MSLGWNHFIKKFTSSYPGHAVVAIGEVWFQQVVYDLVRHHNDLGEVDVAKSIVCNIADNLYLGGWTEEQIKHIYWNTPFVLSVSRIFMGPNFKFIIGNEWDYYSF